MYAGALRLQGSSLYGAPRAAPRLPFPMRRSYKQKRYEALRRIQAGRAFCQPTSMKRRVSHQLQRCVRPAECSSDLKRQSCVAVAEGGWQEAERRAVGPGRFGILCQLPEGAALT